LDSRLDAQGDFKLEKQDNYVRQTYRTACKGHHRGTARRQTRPGRSGGDSLDTVELVMALEEEFGIEVPDEQAEKLQSVGDVIKYVEEAQK
jgi:hypothetical protein